MSPLDPKVVVPYILFLQRLFQNSRISKIRNFESNLGLFLIFKKVLWKFFNFRCLRSMLELSKQALLI